MAQQEVENLEEGEEIGLDAEELLHLAIKAMNQDRDDDALLFIKHALTLAPDEGRLHYLLGAIHAELGMRERAIPEIERAVALDPTLSTASFQLGLLYIATGQEDLARQAWAPLDELEAEDAMRLFKEGMTHFLDENYAAAIEVLRHGMERNDVAESLNDNMEQVIEQAQKLLEAGTTPAKPAKNAGTARARAGHRDLASQQHVLLAGYRKQDEER